MRKPKSKAAHGWSREECFQEENSMSSPVTPPERAAAMQPVLAIKAARFSAARAGAIAPSGAVSLQTLPSGPPSEVLEEMAHAAQIHAALSSQGRELRFARDEQSGRTRIEVRDRSGHVLKTISPSQALALAAGAPLE
jgi:hypothetical protein